MYERETFRGTCFLDSQGVWHFRNENVTTTAFGQCVYFANEEEEILGVITEHTDWGWCISGKNLAGEERETHIPDLSLEPVYLATDYHHAQAPKLFKNNEFDPIPDQ
jgi:hypothetical protein